MTTKSIKPYIPKLGAIALLTLLSTTGAFASEADIKIPALDTVKFAGLGGMSGATLMYLGIVICAIGAYSLNNSVFDVYAMCVFGVLGYVFRIIGCEPAPMLLGFVLGPMIEEHLRRALLLSNGNLTVFVSKPLSATMLFAAAVLLVLVLLPTIRKKREEAFQE